MKKIINILFFIAIGTVSFAQETIYISRDKTTALFFPANVTIVGKIPNGIITSNKGSGVVTLKAARLDLKPASLAIKDQLSHQEYQIAVQYSYGRAGRRVEIGQTVANVSVVKSSATNYGSIGKQLTTGKRQHVVDRQKASGVKTWLSNLSIADNRIFFRVDVRNNSGLPYEIDFVRFYIRDLKTVSRMATHEREIVPVFATFKNRILLSKGNDLANVYAFRRFSLTRDQALNIEIYERNGNRHLYLQIKQKDLDDLKTLSPATQLPVNVLAAIN